ncbi:hypothetical protein JD844_025015 [Phrynosoma platyrhinos]|uniref:Exportin-5 C-terminal domain-containing protein n=1 Tax=Phrynosoma platyrhinos TaxID=52577 RepID=A0ABQ7SZ88_PHRPL|nr:hypothetical protein JD844_025015 [Phrynosoma platyrhinos]
MCIGEPSISSPVLSSQQGSDPDVETPANLEKYLESFLAFTTHPSQFLRSSTQITWGALLRHEILSRDPRLLAIIPNYLRASMTNLVKVGFPSKTDSPSCEYSRFDFDSDEDFNCFFNSFRAQQGSVIRMACRLDPRTGFQMAGEWLKYQLSTPVETGPTNSKTNESHCSIFSPAFVQWDAMTFFLESIISPVFRTLEKEEIPVSDGIELLQLVLRFETKDPLILSCVLSNVSALFPFVTYRPEYLPEVLSKLFASVTFEVIEESKPNFDMLYNHVKQLLSNELLLTQMEKCALMEALVLISNQFKDYERQKIFLEELMSPVVTLWLSEEMKRVLMNSEDFIRYVGADNRITHPVTEDPCGLNRSRISFCVYTILGVVKRACWPASLEEAKAGGFVVGYMSNGNPIYRNPCSVQVLKLFDNLLALIRTHNNLYTPEMVAKLGENFAKALDMLEVEKNAILGNDEDTAEDNPESQEMLEEQLVRLLTREVMDLIECVFTLPFYLADEEMMSAEVTLPSSSELTELGKCLMKQERPRYAELKTVMEEVPEIQKESLEQFDSKLLNVTLKKMAEKRRKDHFKRLIAGCIAKPLGEQFRKEVHIRNLPSLFKNVQPSLQSDVLENSEDGALITLFEP